MTPRQTTLDFSDAPPAVALADAICSRAWWGADDSEAVARYREWETTEWYPDNTGDSALEWWESPAVQAGQAKLDAFLAAHVDKWTCRRCRFWASTDGCTGHCAGLDPERTTRAGSMCEEFCPANA